MSLERKGEREYKKLKSAIEAGKNGDYRHSLEILEELLSGTFIIPETWLLLGRTFHALGDYSKAIAAFNDYLKLKPESSQGYLYMGRTYLTVAMPYKAVPFLRKALELHPDNIQTMALLGTAYLKSKNSRESVNILQNAVEAAEKTNIGKKEYNRIYRAYLNALLVRGVRLCRINDYDLGAQMLRFVLEKGEERADSPFLRLELGRASRETGKLNEALKHYSRALEFAPEDRRIRWSRASVLMALGRNAEAKDDIELIRAVEPNVPELSWNSSLIDIFMIRSFLEAGEWRPAAELCRNCLKNIDFFHESLGFNNKAFFHALYAEALRNLHDYKSAHNHLERAQKQEPEELQYWYSDILVCWEGKNWKALKKALRIAKSLGGEADLINRFSVLLDVRTSKDGKKNLSLLQNAVRALGPEPELMFALGETYLKLGFAEEARNWFEKTVYLKENHEEAWLGKIAALEIQAAEDPAQADELAEAFNLYLEQWPSNFNIRREMALFLIKIFEYSKAIKELERLLLREPSNQSLRRVLAYAYRKTGRFREAAIFLKALLREKPDNLELLLEYSGCLERGGGSKYAIAILEKAKGIFKKSSDLSMALGILYFRNKKVVEALESLREAAELDRKDPRPYMWMAIIARKNKNKAQAEHFEEEAQKRKK